MSGSIALRTDTKDNILGCQLTFCPRCGGEGKELIMTGNRRAVTTCPSCNTQNFGSRQSDTCGRCNHELRGGSSRKMEEKEKLPGTTVCDKCKAELKEHKNIVLAGGVHFRCKDCSCVGVIKNTSEFAAKVRKAHKLSEPDDDGNYKECGVEFTKAEGCPACGQEE